MLQCHDSVTDGSVRPHPRTIAWPTCATRSPSPPRATIRRWRTTACPVSTARRSVRRSSSTEGSSLARPSVRRPGSSTCWGSTTSPFWRRDDPETLDSVPLGMHAVTVTADDEIPPGVVFCLRAEGAAAEDRFQPGYPLAPHYLVHVGADGSVLLPFTQAKAVLDRLKRLCAGKDVPDAHACDRFDATTRQGEDMRSAQRVLAAAVSSIVGTGEERAIASLFSPGGTHAMAGEFAGMHDFEVVAFLFVLVEDAP